jgi:phage FluMu protein Com
MHHYGVFRRLLGCGAGEVGKMTRWGEIKCPRCAEADDLVQAAVAAREAQKAYFKDRSRDNLIASKQAEAALDKMLAAIRKGGE